MNILGVVGKHTKDSSQEDKDGRETNKYRTGSVLKKPFMETVNVSKHL